MDTNVAIALKRIGLSAVVIRADGTREDLGTLCEDFSDEDKARVLAALLEERDD